MRKLIRKLAPGAVLLGLLALIAVTPASVGDAQVMGVAGPGFNIYDVTPAHFTQLATDDTDVMAIVKYVGVEGTGFTQATTTMQVAANAITFLLDGAAVTTFECPITAAPWDGIIDLTNGDCDTYGEIEDIINLYGYDDGWRMVLINAKRADDSISALIVGALPVGDQEGQAILQTSAEATAVAGTLFGSFQAVLTREQREIDWYLSGPPEWEYKPEPFHGIIPYVIDVDWFTTYGAGASGLYIDEQEFVYSDTGGTPTMSIGTEARLYYQVSGATTVTADADIGDLGIFGNPGTKLFVRVLNDNSLSVRTHATQAIQFFVGGGGGVENR